MIQRRRFIRQLAGSAALASLTNAYATSYPAPKDQIITSPNGEYELKIQAESGWHMVRKSGALKNLWSFKRRVWHDEYHVGAEGKYLAWISWEWVRVADLDHPAMIVYSAQGEVARLTHKQIGGRRRKRFGETGPIGGMWRVWRKEVSRAGELVRIKTPSGRLVQINLENGTINL